MFITGEWDFAHMKGEFGPDRPLRDEWMPWIVSGLGGLFLASFVGEHLIFYLGSNFGFEALLVGVFVSGPFILALVYGGYRLDRSDLSPERNPRVIGWMTVGLVAFLGVNLPIMLMWPAGDLPSLIAWGRWAANVGAAAGLLVGTIEAHAIQRTLAAERASLRAEVADNQRQWFDYLNGLLRHEVLNTANVITGYSSLLLEEEELDDRARAHLETICNQSEEMTKVIRDVQVLIEATQDAAELEPRNLSGILGDEVNKLRATYESVDVDVSVPDDIVVPADDLLPRVFANLLRNAVEHNDSAPARIRVTAERSSDTVVVRIADNGPGIPEAERDALFERGDNTGATHGLGLYLVRTLTERYGGTVELAETSPDGSEFTVRLPVGEESSRGLALDDLGIGTSPVSPGTPRNADD